MTRRHIVRFLVLACLSAASLLAAPAPDGAGRTRTLRVGGLLRFDDELKIRFLEVRNDSRCPINARCIWEGDATVVLRVKAGDAPARNYKLHTALEPDVLVIPANQFPPGMVGIPKSYVIRIARLTPQPTAGEKTRQRDYRLKLAISVAQ